MRTWIISLLVVAAGVVLLAFTVYRDEDSSFEVTTTPVRSGPLTMTIETLGTVEPLSQVQVGCEVTGKIIEILVDHDEPVRKGQIICRIDPELAKAENDQSEAEHLRALGALADARLARDELVANLPVRTQQAAAKMLEAEGALTKAEFDWRRVRKLYEAGDATEAERVSVEAAYKRAQAALAGAKATYEQAKNDEKFQPKRAETAVKQSEAALKLAKARLDLTSARVGRCTIQSPIDGIVLRRYFDVGMTVTAAFQTPILFLLAPSLGRVKVNAKVSESDIVHVEEGQRAEFTVEGKQRTKFVGEILHKRNQPDTVQNVVTYTVIIEVDNDERRMLLPGMTVNVEIKCVHRPAALKLSNTALRFKPPLTSEDRRALRDERVWPPRPLGPGGKEALYCKKAEAWQFDEAAAQWRVVPLWVGITDNIETEVLSGTGPGDEFVKKYVDKSSSGFSFKEALKLASPDNRTL